jgi:hypothetical protein
LDESIRMINAFFLRGLGLCGKSGKRYGNILAQGQTSRLQVTAWTDASMTLPKIIYQRLNEYVWKMLSRGIQKDTELD